MQNETVLLDEPTSGLDPRSTDAVVEIIKNMKKNGTKVVISSHDMDLIYEICDYVLDEPTSGLDPRSTDAVVEIIKNMKKNGTKVVISSHDMDLIYEICDYVYVMNKGEIIKEGNSDDVFMDEKMIKNAGLKTPWIIKIYNELKNNEANGKEIKLDTIKTKFAQYK